MPRSDSSLDSLPERGKPRLLDLFCGAGGAAVGYARAGFEVVGVDCVDQPNYPFEFWQDDALRVLSGWHRFGADWHSEDFDAIHASPPCQAHVRGFAALNQQLGRGEHVDLIGPAREGLEALGLPYVIENVEGAPLCNPVRLCGSSFQLPVRRHRLFESNMALLVPPCNHSWQIEPRYWSSFRGQGRPQFQSRVVQVYGNGGGSEHWAEALGIDWMTKRELREAIPPAYTELIGHQLIQQLQNRAAA